MWTDENKTRKEKITGHTDIVVAFIIKFSNSLTIINMKIKKA